VSGLDICIEKFSEGNYKRIMIEANRKNTSEIVKEAIDSARTAGAEDVAVKTIK